jgi:N-acetylmuramoyl-L-alanine amidase
MTREDDRTVSLNDRVALTGAKEADIFVSLHLNYLPKKPLNIIETFYFGPTTDGPTSQLAAKENAGSEIGFSEFQAMLKKINDSLKQEESKKLALDIQKSLYASSSLKNEHIVDYGIKTAPFVVLLGVGVPAVLVEVSCLSNRDEEKKLNTPTHREDIARFLEAGILDYLSKGESPYVARKQ